MSGLPTIEDSNTYMCPGVYDNCSRKKKYFITFRLPCLFLYHLEREIHTSMPLLKEISLTVMTSVRAIIRIPFFGCSFALLISIAKSNVRLLSLSSLSFKVCDYIPTTIRSLVMSSSKSSYRHVFANFFN